MTEQAVLSVLILHRNNATGKLFPSQSKIAKEAKLGRTTVNAALDGLVLKGWVKRHKQPAPKPTHYTVHVPNSSRAEQSNRRTPTVHVPNVDSSPGEHELVRELKNELLRDAPSPSADDAAGDSQRIVAHLNDLLTAHGFPGVTEWGKARRMATNALKRAPVQEAIDALTWAFANPFWRQRLASDELKWLKPAWAEWKDPSKATPIRGRNVYQDKAKTPELSPALMEVAS